MNKKTEPVWAIDRNTGKTAQFPEGRVAAFPNRYLRVDAPVTKKSAARSVSPATDVANSEGGA